MVRMRSLLAHCFVGKSAYTRSWVWESKAALLELARALFVFLPACMPVCCGIGGGDGAGGWCCLFI